MQKYLYRVYLNNRSFEVTQEAMTPSDGQILVEQRYNARVVWMGVA